MAHTFQVGAPNPFDFAGCVRRFSRYGGDPVNRVEDGALLRVIRVDGRPAVYRAAPAPGGMTMTIARPGDEPAVRADVTHRFAFALDPGPVGLLARRDPGFAPHWAAHRGLRPPLTPDPFEQIVTSITAQQVNLRWATETRRRLVAAYGDPVAHDGRLLRAFPEPGRLAAVDPAELRALQFTGAKAASIVALARAAAGGELDGLDALADEAIVAALVRHRGIGPWTARWFLARCLGRPGAVAWDDLGVRKAIGIVYLGGTAAAPVPEVAAITGTWGDAANWAMHVLLESLAAVP